MKAKAKSHVVTVWKIPNGQWYWHREASNGKIVSCSGESCANKAHAIKMAKLCNVGCEVRVEDGK